jgi:hypothetical protein
MKNFKFLNDFTPIERDSHNGVTDANLIRLSREIWSYSDWINSVMLTNNNGNTEDYLIFDFKDIDGSEYSCRIATNGSFQLLQLITTEDGDYELMDTLDISDEVLSDYDNIIQYLSNMPNTIANSL